MKKTKILAVALVALTMTASAGALAACNNTDEHKCGHVCPTCQKCTSDCTDDVCKDKCEGHENNEAIDLTEGVFSRMMGSYELLIKFYDANTYYLQNETSGYRGKYEIKDEEITFARTQDDGTEFNTETHPNEAKWITENKVIYFYQEDGVTPIDCVLTATEQGSHNASVVPAKTCYAYGTKANTLAYNVELDQIQSMKGNYGSRTLTHTKLRNFTVNDEKAIEQAKYMVKDLPADAEEGKVKSDYFLTLSQKGYETNIPALEALDITNGKFTKTNDATYTLTDTISGATATMTVTATGATVTCGTTTVELLEWKDSHIVTPTGNVVLKKDMTASIGSGENINNMQGSVTFYDSGAVVISVTSAGLNVTGSYKAESGKGLTVTNIGEMTLTQSGLSLVLGGTASVGGKSAPISATITCTQAELGALVSSSTPAVTEVLKKDMTALIAGANELQGSITFKSDGTVVVSVPTVGLNVTGHYTAVSGQGLTVTDIGEMTLTQSGLSLVLGGTASVGGKSAPISATITCTQAELGALVNSSTPAVTEKLAKDMTALIAGANELQGSITFYSDGTVKISVPTVGLNVTGHYTAVSGQGLTVTDIGEMTLTQSGLSLVLGGTASVGGKSAPISATITCTQAELMALMA